MPAPIVTGTSVLVFGVRTRAVDDFEDALGKRPVLVPVAGCGVDGGFGVQGVGTPASFPRQRARGSFIEHLLVRIHCTIEIILWTGLALGAFYDVFQVALYLPSQFFGHFSASRPLSTQCILIRKHRCLRFPDPSPSYCLLRQRLKLSDTKVYEP